MLRFLYSLFYKLKEFGEQVHLFTVSHLMTINYEFWRPKYIFLFYFLKTDAVKSKLSRI